MSFEATVGGTLGLNGHVANDGMMGGAQLGVGFRVGWVRAGSSLGFFKYGDAAGVPIASTTFAVHLGVSPTLIRDVEARRTLELFAIGAAELGWHGYEARGKEFITIGPAESYSGPSETVLFGGLRAGLALAVTQPQRSFGGIFKLELVGRRDRDTVDLTYRRTSCGGLFDPGCTTDSGTTRAGGHELAALLTLGLLIGD